jgi:anaerobic selenocysteine-containing dehydrogenase
VENHPVEAEPIAQLAKSAGEERLLHRHEDFPTLSERGKDALRLGIPPHGRVSVSSRRGTLAARAFITSTIQPGHIFVPMHYVETNRLTLSAFDPYSRQPSYKACAVRIERAARRRIQK